MFQSIAKATSATRSVQCTHIRFACNNKFPLTTIRLDQHPLTSPAVHPTIRSAAKSFTTIIIDVHTHSRIIIIYFIVSLTFTLTQTEEGLCRGNYSGGLEINLTQNHWVSYFFFFFLTRTRVVYICIRLLLSPYSKYTYTLRLNTKPPPIVYIYIRRMYA